MSQIDTLQRHYGYHKRMDSHQAVQTPGEEGNHDKGEQATIQAIEEQLSQTGPTLIPSSSKRSRPTQLSSGFTPFRNQQISGQESPFFTIPRSFQEKTRIHGQKQDIFQQKAERVRPNDPEAVGLGERSTQEPKIVVNTYTIRGPNNTNITPTKNENSVATPESSLNSDSLWLQMSQFSEKTQKQFGEFQESHERMNTLAASIDKIVKNLQEGNA
ncbi:hypothetical protein O181_016827 [Austropuccinia psidii MF-1]|uniref:Uncharacterized protein n=1 Tax=Austropuccinia psidii MF-1 TaxID=1389203 RepID=A0A9Q3C4T6_9BASI|nr:hypothetical protein [Austropuccinia psidii MF-1]